MKANPFKDILYVNQINSVEELGERAKLLNKNMKEAQDYLNKTKEALPKARLAMQQQT